MTDLDPGFSQGLLAELADLKRQFEDLQLRFAERESKIQELEALIRDNEAQMMAMCDDRAAVEGGPGDDVTLMDLLDFEQAAWLENEEE